MHRLFWNSCPKNLDMFPEHECPLGKKGTLSCAWSINSAEDNYCFWSWVRRESDVNGAFDPPSQNKIAELLNISPAKFPSALAEAISNLQKLPGFEEIKAYALKNKG